MYKISISILLIFLTNVYINFSYSQNKEQNEILLSSNLKLAYTGSLIYPGLKGGLEIPALSKIIQKDKKKESPKTTRKHQFLTLNVGWYHQPDFHSNLYTTIGYTFRKIRQKGLFTEWGVEVGYSRTFLANTTYSVSKNGKVSSKNSGYNYMICSSGTGIGYDFRKTKLVPISLYGKLNILFMAPYNNTFYVRPNIEIGVIYFPTKFLSRTTKSKKIHR